MVQSNALYGGILNVELEIGGIFRHFLTQFFGTPGRAIASRIPLYLYLESGDLRN